MSQKGILVDYNRCVGCRACELACREENKTVENINWIQNIKIGPEILGGNLVMQFVSFPCMHCGKAPCLEVCPAKAISREPNGVVLVDENKCIGCKFCLWVCPFGAPQFDAKKGKITKCKLCIQRLEKNLKPACVTACHPRALVFGTTEELSEYLRKKSARKVLQTPLPLTGFG